MRSFTTNWLWKAFLLSLAVFLGTATLSWAQDNSGDFKDPSTITIVPIAPEGGRAVGDDCTNPIIVSVPSALPYNNTNYTCGRGNTYNLGTSSCMYYYSGGEDIIYRLDATANVMITLTMNPLGTTWTGIGIFNGCPNTGTCLGAAYNSGIEQQCYCECFPDSWKFLLCDAGYLAITGLYSVILAQHHQHYPGLHPGEHFPVPGYL